MDIELMADKKENNLGILGLEIGKEWEEEWEVWEAWVG